MELLNYQSMKENLTAPETKLKATIGIYGKKNGEIVGLNTYSLDGWQNTVESQNLLGEEGEYFWFDEYLFFSIGSIAERSTNEVMSGKIMAAMKKAYAIVKNNTEIRFLESKYTKTMIYGFVIGSYRYSFLNSEKEGKKIFINMPEHSETMEVAHAQNFARFLSDTPANHMTPKIFVEYAKKYLEGLEIEIEILDEPMMSKNGMGLLLSVGHGSKEESRLLHVKYIGNKSAKNTKIALVGKGVTFDSGGISLKPSSRMALMKSDMTGGAIALAVFGLLVHSDANANISLTIPLVENLPGGSATKPGDVFKSMSGKTVEVDNTDAEGRLILGDALTYAQRDSPEYLIDLATLTGAMFVALGPVYTGFFTNNDELASLILEESQKTSDLAWRLPLSEFYKSSLKSNIADLCNMGGPGAGSSKAAEFLQCFVEPETKWIHFDIAGMIDRSHQENIYGKMITGRPTCLLYHLLKRLIN